MMRRDKSGRRGLSMMIVRGTERSALGADWTGPVSRLAGGRRRRNERRCASCGRRRGRGGSARGTGRRGRALLSLSRRGCRLVWRSRRQRVVKSVSEKEKAWRRSLLVVWDGHCDCGAPWLQAAGWARSPSVRLAGQEPKGRAGWLGVRRQASGARRVRRTGLCTMGVLCYRPESSTDLRMQGGTEAEEPRKEGGEGGRSLRKEVLQANSLVSGACAPGVVQLGGCCLLACLACLAGLGSMSCLPLLPCPCPGPSLSHRPAASGQCAGCARGKYSKPPDPLLLWVPCPPLPGPAPTASVHHAASQEQFVLRARLPIGISGGKICDPVPNHSIQIPG